MSLVTGRYLEVAEGWPDSGRHILASYDDDTVVVYQAYRPAIGKFAAENGYFGGEFSYSRMSWVKPNFLWMMYRSGWGTKPDQEVTLAVRLNRPFFDEILSAAVPSSFDSSLHTTRDEWSDAVARSEVRLQWDPDHGPTGAKLERRAIQLGLRGRMLERYGREEVVEIVDLSEWVADERKNAKPAGFEQLRTPLERVYLPQNETTQVRLGLQMVRA